MTNISKMTEIASKTLGDSTSYAVYTSEYDPSLLNPMPRNLARDENDISGSEFDGFDVWHCYEATFLTDQGHPVLGSRRRLRLEPGRSTAADLDRIRRR